MMTSRLLFLLLLCVNAAAGLKYDNVWKYFSWSQEEMEGAMPDTVLDRKLE